jgi:hypothetical protein
VVARAQQGDRVRRIGWVDRQRCRQDRISPERKQQLDAVGFSWNSLESGWEDGFAALTAYKAREGHCCVPTGHVEDIFRLGMWVNNQRFKNISAEHRKRLDSIGFVWDVLEAKWKEGFASLKTFKARKGHCRVPTAHVEGTYRLGMWVGNQRNKDTSAERRKRLDAVGFVWNGA